MNLRQLECFFVVAETLHFGRAAERLFMAQSSVSEQVTSLEKELGERLFVRTTRRVLLTSFGAEFLTDIRPRYDQLRLSFAKFQRITPGQRSLRLGHTPELGHWLFPKLLGLIDGMPEERHPVWTPMLLHTHEQIESLLEGSLDLGLCWEASVPPGIGKAVLAKTPFVAVIREDDPLALQREICLSDLLERHLLVSPRPDNSFLDSKLQTAMAEAGLTKSALEEVAGYNEISIHVRTSRAVGVHPAPIATINRTPGVTFRLLADPELLVEVCLIWRESADADQRLQMIDLLRQSAVDAVTDTGRSLEGQRPGAQ